MKVQKLIDQLSFISPNYDVMVKVGDSERDLITRIGSINCVNSKINPPSGFIELETCNAIDWLRAFYNEAIPKAEYEALKQHLFELSYSIDSHSSSKDYAALRNTHYENQNWIKENGLQDEYYNYFFRQIKEIKDALC